MGFALVSCMSRATLLQGIRTKFELLQPLMSERLRRQWAASETLTLPRGGTTLVAEATGLSRTTIWAGRQELRQQAELPPEELQPQRIRAPGGGRHLLEVDDPTLLRDLEALVAATSR